MDAQSEQACQQIDKLAKKHLTPASIAEADARAVQMLRDACGHVADDLDCAQSCKHRDCRNAGRCERPLFTETGAADNRSCLARNGCRWAQARARVFELVFFALRPLPLDLDEDDRSM